MKTSAHRSGYAGLSTAVMYDAAQQVLTQRELDGCVFSDLTRGAGAGFVGGPAYCIKVRPNTGDERDGREKWFSAIDMAPADHVVVIEAPENVGGAVIGDIVGRQLVLHGVAGVVVAGLARDTAGLRELGLSVWSSGVTMAGMSPRMVQTDVGVPVLCGRTRIGPESFVFGDDDGVLVLPQADVGRLLEMARTFAESEAETHRKLMAGSSLFSAYPPKEH